MDDRGPSPHDFVQSVSRALRVLELVGNEPGLPVKAIARRAGLNISTTYHLVRTLAYEGYLVRLPTGCYEVGAELPRRAPIPTTPAEPSSSRSAATTSDPRSAPN
jgi:hypothetical protein